MTFFLRLPTDLFFLSFASRFEFVKRIHLSMVPFSVEDNTLTPTFKLRRRDAYAKYKAELDGLYTLGEVNGQSSKL
jgi:long-chain acyl-CoA synthetase